MSQETPPASIIVPVFREAANIEPLVERVFSTLRDAGRSAELIFVDDNSQDGSEELVTRLSARYSVRILVRTQERGLSSAVLAGFDQAQYDRFVVLDGDLQHPPELIPRFLEPLERDDCDFVIGTRYASGGSIAESWPFLRRLASRLATMFARPLAPVSDPMSGYFALRRSTWRRAVELNPIGYKIALELYVKARCRHPVEVPIQFDSRHAGQSKLSLAEQLRYGRHLLRLYYFRFPWVVWTGSLIVIGVLVAIGVQVVT